MSIRFRLTKHLMRSAALMYATLLCVPQPTLAQQTKTYTCIYTNNPKMPPVQLMTDGKVRFGNGAVVTADSYSVEDQQAQYYVTRADGGHFIGFDLTTGKGSDSIENNGNHKSLPMTCRQN